MQKKMDVNQGEIVLYQPDEEVRIEVRLEEDTVWLTQAQMVELFKSTKQNISLHVNNIFKEGELDRAATVKEYLTVQKEGSRNVQRKVTCYNLDVIISVGYRVKSIRGTQFRIWANKVLKEYLLKGYSVSQRIADMEQRVSTSLREHEERLGKVEEKVDFFIHTSLPPVEGVFYDGQVFDAYKFVSDLIRTAKESILLIDNYVDESVLMMLGKRGKGVSATICTQRLSRQLQLDLVKYDAQYPPIELRVCKNIHDRFLIIDNAEVYHIGASLKDLGKKMFAFSKLGIPAESLTSCLSDSR